ncbi:MAG: dihydrofolate reductase [Anaerolineae bacterium]|nr:dihydrofolate reductase [Anaerolineae bacterium]
MRNLVVSQWMTLNGVFDGDSMDQWNIPYESKERAAYNTNLILGCGAYLMGKNTYEMLAPYWSILKNNENGIADKLNSVPKYVVSTTLKKADWNNSTIIKENVVEEITKLKQQSGKEILIQGSATLVKSLMETDLIDEYRFLVNPIIMGSGKHFFKQGMDTTKLELIETKAFSLGVVMFRYKLVKK